MRGPEKYGVKGVVFFADPFKGGDSPNTAYPRGQWLPADGVVEGSVYFYANEGDPLTPGIPSLDGMYRLPYNESRLPGIPAQPISYGSAMELLRRLGGTVLSSYCMLLTEIQQRLLKCLSRSDITSNTIASAVRSYWSKVK